MRRIFREAFMRGYPFSSPFKGEVRRGMGLYSAEWN